MNRPFEDEFQLWKNPVSDCGQSSTETSGSESPVVSYTGPSAARDARLRSLKKWHSTNALPLMSHYPSYGILRGSMSMSAVGVFPIIEDADVLAASRWESLPSSMKQLSAQSTIPGSSQSISVGCSATAQTAKKLGLPKPPRRQKSVEVIADSPF
jgi:hypothetical protein